jgi:DNA topoisomerase-3
MDMKLYICEKPGQARDLARNLGVNGKGDGFIGDNSVAVTWAIGHLVQKSRRLGGVSLSSP